MSQINLTQMADILPLIMNDSQVSNNGLSSVSFLLVSTLLIIVSGLIFLHFYNKPINQIKRQLKKQQISPREACHRIAQLIINYPDKSKIISCTEQINKLRFQRQSPDLTNVLALIDQLKNDH